MPMKRVIKSYENAGEELIMLLAEKYPDGIQPSDLSFVTTIKGDRIKVVEIATEDTLYMVKFSAELEEAINDIDLDEIAGTDDEESTEDRGSDAAMTEAEEIPDGDF